MKLYDQILSACRSFLGMEADATEAEIHNALDGKTPLAQIENGTAMADLTLQMSALTEKVTGLETQVTTFEATIAQLSADNTQLQADVTAHLATIAANEAAISAKETEISNLTASHNTQITGLAGQIAALKAGKTVDKVTDSAAHAVNEFGNNTPVRKIIPLADDKLREYLKQGN